MTKFIIGFVVGIFLGASVGAYGAVVAGPALNEEGQHQLLGAL